jgi:hypothetical protein
VSGQRSLAYARTKGIRTAELSVGLRRFHVPWCVVWLVNDLVVTA